MNCPVCARSLAPTLSICPTCGAMMNDTVREELQTKITSGVLPRTVVKPPAAQERIPLAPPPRPIVIPPVAKKTVTADLASPKTSPTLVEFQNKNASLPDWRLQLQNAVQQRKGAAKSEVASPAAAQFPSSGATALKAEIVPTPQPETMPAISDPRVAKAMQRIAESRKAFLEPQEAPKRVAAKPVPARAFKFDVVSANASPSAGTGVAPARVMSTPKPILVSATPVAEKRDTNKLPRIDRVERLEPEPVPVAEVDEPVATEASAQPQGEFADIKRIQIRAEPLEDDRDDAVDTAGDEIEDLAPFSMRFGAGLFDLIIGAFASMLLLSPLAFTNGDWFTAVGVATMLGTWATVLFLYMTVCLGFFGKTMGMRLFSLELVDAVENEYPTLRQAAVNSCVFLISLVFGGAGFLTAYFNEERRALHDLLSGTILVREF